MACVCKYCGSVVMLSMALESTNLCPRKGDNLFTIYQGNKIVYKKNLPLKFLDNLYVNNLFRSNIELVSYANLTQQIQRYFLLDNIRL